MLIDTHAHLDYPDYEQDLGEVLARARDAGVTRVLTIGTGVASSRRAVELAERHPEVYAVVGVHPCHAGEEDAGFPQAITELTKHPRVVAIGETGLDYHRLPGAGYQPPPAISALQAESEADIRAALADGAAKSIQAEVFRAQLEIAVECGMNVVVHQRDAWQDTLDILKPYRGKLRAVFHCFGGTAEQAAELIVDGHLVSFTGIITFKNAAMVRETAAAIPADAFMVETDCPYLAPAPFRGKRCEPAHTRLVAEKLAEIRGCDLDFICQSTTRTAEAFFRFP